MKRVGHLLLLLVFGFALRAPIPQAQGDAGAQSRESDDQATTVEARQRALATLLMEASQLRNAGDAPGAARVLNRAGRLQSQLYLSKDALVTYRQAAELLKQTTDSAAYVDSLNGLSHVYKELSKCDRAQPLLRRAISLSDQNNYPDGKGEALLVLSDCQNFSDHSLAVQTAQEALTLWLSLGDKDGIARSYAAIGDYQLAHDNLTEAKQSSEAALMLWRELGAAAHEAEALVVLGYIEYRKGAWDDVLRFLTQAEGLIDEKAEPYKMGQIVSGIAEAFSESGSPETGLTKYQQALEYYQLSGNPRAIIATRLGVGKTYYLLSKYREAIENLESARVDAEAIKEKAITALCNDYLGRTYFATNDQQASLSHFQAALEQYTQVGKQMEAARTRALIGQVYEQQGSLEKAKKAYQQALKTFGILSDQVNESATLYVLGGLVLKQNNLDLAEDYLQRSIKVTENMRRVSTSSDLTVAFSATVHERYQRFIECLMRKHLAQPEQGLAVRAFETSELARARSLAELLRTTQTNLVPGLNPELARQEKLFRQSLKVKEDSRVALLARNYTREELQALDGEVARLETEYKQVTETIRKRYPSYQQVTRPDAWDLRQIQEQVIADDQTVLVEYSFGADKSYVWTVTRDDIKSYELPARARINEAAEKVYRLLTTIDLAKSSDELSHAIRELRQMILSPVAAELNKARMIVVADGALHYIPFQILPVSDAGDDSLVSTTEIINAPSASILGQLRDETGRRQAPTDVLVAFGDPIFESNYAQRKRSNSNEYVASVQPPEAAHWRHALRDIELTGDSLTPAAIQPLRYAKRELANLRDVAGPQTLMVTGFDATREKLASADLTKYAILHFATHGLLDPKRPEKSGLLLSMVNSDGREQNGFVGLQDIYGLYAPVDLVVLSACRTGLGKDVQGEGLIGLTRGFMYAGASSVVASLWQVDDEATAELMKEFYTNLLQKAMPPAAALRAAQNTIRQKPEWRAPYYWAAFTVQGEYRQVIRPASAVAAPHDWWIIVVVAVLVLFAAAAWWYRRIALSK